MKIISTNTAKPTKFIWNGKEETTGIYKKPNPEGIYLDFEGVHNDEVSDKKVHGGEFKACYLFSQDQYSYWENKYPALDWTWGMFGENLTVSNLDERQLTIGDIYKVGDALVQITQPREPCYKFGVKFKSESIIKEFLDHGFPGSYVRVLTPGKVNSEDTFTLIEHKEDSLTTAQLYKLIFAKNKNQSLLKLAIKNEALPERKRNKLSKFIK